ncbi:MAG: WXG100 family type VII secretion target [Anaerolineae bacterium]|jgi:WXG100 family type VII secretion target|nr:WXG100 family type VII secretion target [Anaerolineae bacterium]
MAEKTEVNYDQLEDLGKRFIAEGAMVQAIRVKLLADTEKLHGEGWIGQAADKFHTEMTQEVLPAVQRLFEALNDAGGAMMTICNIFNEAEEETQGYFKSLGD